MILIKAAPGLVIELSAGPRGLFDQLSVKIAESLSAQPLVFEIGESNNGRLTVRPTEQRELFEMTAFLSAIGANEGKILAEVRKYRLMG